MPEHDGAVAGTGRCELCQREGVLLTRHHLIPRMQHRRRTTQRRFARDEMRQRVLYVCRPCHNHIHLLFSEKQLASEFNTLEALLTDTALREFVAWIARKPAGFKPKSGRRPKR
ncbi:MAG: hypothetical protein PVF75_09615 [Granulosicoccaceae bacterium]|jgi:hypothetical protein